MTRAFHIVFPKSYEWEFERGRESDLETDEILRYFVWTNNDISPLGEYELIVFYLAPWVLSDRLMEEFRACKTVNMEPRFSIIFYY